MDGRIKARPAIAANPFSLGINQSLAGKHMALGLPRPPPGTETELQTMENSDSW
jgi:hypothetical protein